MDSSQPTFILFPHEDVLARTLSYELDLARVRLEAIQNGFQDPGRPPYERVFEVCDYVIPSYLTDTKTDPPAGSCGA